MVSPFVKQSWVVSGVLANIMGLGMIVAYPASLLPGLRAPDSPIQVDLDSASFLASSVGISSCIGFVGSSVFMEMYGRKWAHVILMGPGFLGWLLISFARNYSMLLIGRLLGGITAGGTVTLGAVVIGEYSNPVSRGLFLNLKTSATCLGSLVIHIMAHYFTWRTVALLCLIPMVIALGNILTWPESPSWLASRDRFDECERSFFYLRGRSEESVKEIVAMVRAQKKRSEFTAEMSRTEVVTNFLKKFGRKDFVVPVSIIFFGFILLEACGRHIFPAYALEFVGSISGDRSRTFLYTLCMDLIVTATATFSCVLVKTMKRRSLLYFSSISAIVILLMVSLYLYLSSKGIIGSDKSWIPCSMLVLYLVVSNLGCTSVPLILLGEIFPLPHRGAGTCIAGLTMSITLVIALQMTPKLIAAVSVHGTFAVLALIMSVSLLILSYILPETKNKTLQEIEDYFNHGKFLDDKAEVDNEESRKSMLRTESQHNKITDCC